MAEIRPFRGHRYGEAAGRLDDLIAPPTETLTTAARATWRSRSDRHLFHLADPEGSSDDRSKYVRYARSAALLSQWRRDGTLLVDADPAYYLVRADVGTSWLVALARLPYGSETRDLVPPDDATVQERDHRLRLLEATRTHFETVTGEASDRDGVFATTLANVVGEELASAEMNGVRYQMLRIVDAATVAQLTEWIASNRIRVTAGAANWAAAVQMRAVVREDGTVQANEFIPIAISSDQTTATAIVPSFPAGLIFWSLNDY